MKCPTCNGTLEECTICGGELHVAKTNSKYFDCKSCGTHIQIGKDTSCDQSFYEDVYLQDIENEKRVLRTNVAHYEELFKKFSSIQQCRDFFATIDDTIDECHCYGGGFPQIELSIPVNKILIYDLIAAQYRKNLKLLSDIYVLSDYEIKYKKHDLLKGIIKPAAPVCLTFVHILEHFSISDIDLILKSVNDKAGSGSCGIIYQPNITKATGPSWVHYDDQHLTFYTIETFTKLLNEYSNIEVVYSLSHSDDLLILFKVK